MAVIQLFSYFSELTLKHFQQLQSVVLWPAYSFQHKVERVKAWCAGLAIILYLYLHCLIPLGGVFITEKWQMELESWRDCEGGA